MTAVRSCGSSFSGFHTSSLPVLPIGEWGLKAEKIDCFLFCFFVCFFFIYASRFILHPLVPLFLRVSLWEGCLEFAVDHEPEPQHTDTNCNTDANKMTWTDPNFCVLVRGESTFL